MGPLEFLAVSFEGNRFSGEIMPELQALREKGIIRILDFLFLTKDSAGNSRAVELTELAMERGALLADEDTGEASWFAEDDIEAMSEALPSNSSVAMVLLEHTWAGPLAAATRRAGGEVIAFERIPAADVDRVLAELRTPAGASATGAQEVSQ